MITYDRVHCTLFENIIKSSVCDRLVSRTALAASLCCTEPGSWAPTHRPAAAGDARGFAGVGDTV